MKRFTSVSIPLSFNASFATFVTSALLQLGVNCVTTKQEEGLNAGTPKHPRSQLDFVAGCCEQHTGRDLQLMSA